MLGPAYADAREEPQAVALLTAALQAAEEALGSRHEITIKIRGALACCRALTGELEAAAAEYDRAIVDATESLGKDDPETVALREERDELGLP